MIMCLFNHFLDARVEVDKLFRLFFGGIGDKKKNLSEIKWPLELTEKEREES